MVGYGVWEGDGVTKFWKVKNSWSSKWGMDGYILLEKGIDQIGGQCGMSFSLYLLPPPSPLLHSNPHLFYYLPFLVLTRYTGTGFISDYLRQNEGEEGKKVT